MTIDAAALSLIMSIEGQIAAPEAELLYQRASEATVCIVEIGSFRGRSTVALALGSKAGNSVPVFAIDPHESAGDGDYPYGPEDRVAFMRNVVDAGVADIVRPINLTSDAAFAWWTRTIDLLFIDGDHEGRQPYYDLLFGTDGFADGGIVIMHDRHADGVRAAIKEIAEMRPNWQITDGPGSIVELRKP